MFLNYQYNTVLKPCPFLLCGFTVFQISTHVRSHRHHVKLFVFPRRKPVRLVLKQPLIWQTTWSLRTVPTATLWPEEGLWRRSWLSSPVSLRRWDILGSNHDWFWDANSSSVFLSPQLSHLRTFLFLIYRQKRRYCKGQRRLHAHVL